MASWNVKILLPAIFLLCACAQVVGGTSTILSEKFSKFIERKVVREDENIFFVGSGFCMHSSYAVKNTEISSDNGIIHINIEIIPVTPQTRAKKLTGNFSFKIQLTPDTSKIVFGLDNTVIWERAGG